MNDLGHRDADTEIIYVAEKQAVTIMKTIRLHEGLNDRIDICTVVENHSFEPNYVQGSIALRGDLLKYFKVRRPREICCENRTGGIKQAF